MTLGLQYWEEDRDDFSRSISVTCRAIVFSLCGPDQDVTKYKSWQDLYADANTNAGAYRTPTLAETDSLSAYAMLEWDITDTIALTLEDRYVKEEFDATVAIGASCVNAFPFNADLVFYNPANDTNQPNCIPGNIESGSTDTDYHAPKVTLEWQATDTAMLYGLVAKGVKPPGYSLIIVPIKFAIPLDAYKFEEEEMWSYEIGAKTNWDGKLGSLLFNTAVFYQDYSDKQTNTQQQIGNFVVGVPTNASAAWVRGLEVETNWATPLEGLSAGVAWTWLDSEYDDFKDPTRSATRIAIAGTCGNVVEIRGTDHCEIDLSGNTLEYMPEHSVVLTGRYENTLFTDVTWYLESNASWQTERYTSADNFTKLEDYWLADVRLGFSGEAWDVIAYVNNVFDDDTITSSGGNTDVAAGYVASETLTPPTLTTAFLPPPRTAGLRVLLRF